MGTTSNYDDSVKMAFFKQFERLLHEYTIVPFERDFPEDLSIFKVSVPTHTQIKTYPLRNRVGDLHFNFVSTYTRCHEYDPIRLKWDMVPIPARFSKVQSRAFTAIFRALLTQEPKLIAKELYERKINFLCLGHYDGTVTKRELKTILGNHQIYLFMVAGIKKPEKTKEDEFAKTLRKEDI